MRLARGRGAGVEDAGSELEVVAEVPERERSCRSAGLRAGSGRAITASNSAFSSMNSAWAQTGGNRKLLRLWI